MSISTGTILKVVCTLVAADSGIMQNVFNAIVTGEGGPWDEQDLTDDLTDWLDAIYTNLGTGIPATVDPSEAVAYEWDPVDEDWDEIGSAIPTFTTTGTGELLPRGVAALVNAKTSDPDVNGKKYFGSLTEGMWDSDAWDSALMAALAAAGVDWFTIFVGATSGATFAPAIWSPTRGNAFLMTGVFVIPTEASYQRRRKPGVGV